MLPISYLVQYALSEHAGDITASTGEGGSQEQSLWDKYKSLDVNEIINDMFFEGISLQGQDEENHEEEEEHMEEEQEEQEQNKISIVQSEIIVFNKNLSYSLCYMKQY